MAKDRRCNLFDDNGRPRRMRDGTKGCSKDASACRFAHPHEREWKAAESSFPPRHEMVADSDSEFYYRLMHPDRRDREKEKEREKERGRERERGKERKKSSSFLESPPRRRDSTTTRPSPGPSSSRRSTFDSATDGAGATKRGWSPAPSSTSDQLERLRKDNQHRTNDLSSRRDHPLSTSRRSDKERADLPNKTPPEGSRVSETRRTDISVVAHPPSTFPPEPPKPPPMQPPPPLSPLPEVPKVPSFASDEATTSTTGSAFRGLKEMSIDEQRSAWHERIDLMFTSITSRRDYAKLESDLSHIHLLSNSPLANNMPEADRAHINAQKMTLELQMTEKRKEVNETVQKLIGSNFWPVLRTPQISELEKTLEDAKKHILEVKGILDEVKRSCAALFKTSGASDWTQDSDRPSKRRRLDGEADELVQSPSGNAEFVTEDTARELEAFRDKLTELERHLVDLENDIIQRDGVISDEIELHIEARLEEEGALYSPVREPGEVSEAEIEAVVDAKNKELVHAVTVTGEEIGALAVEVAELITKVNTLEARCQTLEAENCEFKTKLAQDSLQHAKSQDAFVRRDKEIEAIAAALQAYISQAPAGQTTGDLPSAEYIVESLGSHLDGLFRDKFSATMVNVQQEVFDKVQETHNHTLDTLSPKIVLLLKMVNLITARLGKPDIYDAVNVT